MSAGGTVRCAPSRRSIHGARSWTARPTALALGGYRPMIDDPGPRKPPCGESGIQAEHCSLRAQLMRAADEQRRHPFNS